MLQISKAVLIGSVWAELVVVVHVGTKNIGGDINHGDAEEKNKGY